MFKFNAAKLHGGRSKANLNATKHTQLCMRERVTAIQYSNGMRMGEQISNNLTHALVSLFSVKLEKKASRRTREKRDMFVVN